MKNFCVIDIGTNAVKIKIFSDGRYVSLRNKLIGQVNNNVSKDDILRHVQDFIHEAKDGYQVPQNQEIYLTGYHAYVLPFFSKRYTVRQFQE